MGEYLTLVEKTLNENKITTSEKDTACAACGWPIKKGDRSVKTPDGSTTCMHLGCPAKLAKRKEQEAEASAIRDKAVKEWEAKTGKKYDPTKFFQ